MIQDIVIPLRNNFKETQEKIFIEKAVYLLRKNITHRNIFFYGGNPEIKGTTHIPFEDKNTDNLEANLIRINLAACDNPEVSDPFIWSASDIFVNKPIENIPLWHKGNLLTGMSQYEDWANNDTNMKYIRRCINTAIICFNLNLEMLNFDCHLPCPIYKTHYKNAYSQTKWDTEKIGVLQLTLYGNYLKSKNFKVEQCELPWGDSKSLLSTINLENKEDIINKLKDKIAFSPPSQIHPNLLEYINNL